MKFVKLTVLRPKTMCIAGEEPELEDYGHDFINVEKIIAITPTAALVVPSDNKSGVIAIRQTVSRLYIGEENYFYVREIPEEIIEKINQRVANLELLNVPKISNNQIREIIEDPKYWQNQDPKRIEEVKKILRNCISDEKDKDFSRILIKIRSFIGKFIETVNNDENFFSNIDALYFDAKQIQKELNENEKKKNE